MVQRQCPGDTVHDGQHVRAERRLQLRVLVEVVEDDLGHGVALESHDDAQADTVRGLVVDLGDPGDLAVTQLLGDRQDHVVRVDLIGQLRDDDDRPVALLLDGGLAPHPDRTTTGGLVVVDPLLADDVAVRREVRALDPFHARREGLLLAGVGVVQAPVDRLGHLAQVVRRHLGGHADRDAARAVDQQVRDPRGQDDGLGRLTVVVRLEVDGVLVDVPDHLHGQWGHLALGVAHGRGAVVAPRAEVPLPVDHRVPHGPRLGETHEGVVDRRVTVRVVVTHRVGDRLGRLHVTTLGPVAVVPHRVQDATVHRLEPVPNIRECSPDDDAHRVVDVASLHLGLDVDRLDPVVAPGLGRQRRVRHGLLFCRARSSATGHASTPPVYRASRNAGSGARGCRSAAHHGARYGAGRKRTSSPGPARPGSGQPSRGTSRTPGAASARPW